MWPGHRSDGDRPSEASRVAGDLTRVRDRLDDEDQHSAESSAMLLAEGLSALDDLPVDATLAAALLNGAVNEAALWIAQGRDAGLVETALQRLVGSLRQSSNTGVGARP
jgi:hypothetical protein